MTIDNEEINFTCRKCGKESDCLQNQICENCMKERISYMEYWNIKDPEEATELYFLQQLNKRIQQKNKLNGKKAGAGIYDKLPRDLKENLKEDGYWEEVKNELIKGA